MFITMTLLTTLAFQGPGPAAESATSSSSSSSSSPSSSSPSAAVTGMPTASPPVADATLGLAVLNLQTSGDVPADIAPALSGLMTAQLDKTGVFRVVSEDDVKQMVNFDQMKVALSCDDQASCLSEVGAALGVPYMLTGSLARLGSNLSLSLTLVAIDSAQVEKRTSAVYADVDALVAGLPTEVERVVATLLYRQGGNLSVQVSEEGATVAIDGAVVGTAPLPMQPVSSGPHRITVDAKASFNSPSTSWFVQRKSPPSTWCSDRPRRSSPTTALEAALFEGRPGAPAWAGLSAPLRGSLGSRGSLCGATVSAQERG